MGKTGHAPYPPDLTPSDFFLFSKLKFSLKGRRFQTIEEMAEGTKHTLNQAHVTR
jgi:hypothetical protein